MTTIHKYQLAPFESQRIEMPHGAKILSVQAQGDDLVIWAQVAPANSPESRTIQIYGTGMVLDSQPRIHLGTVQMHGGSLVWHVFERME